MSFQDAQQLAEYGFNILPAKLGQKAPRVSWKTYAETNTAHMLRNWFGSRESNYWMATGGISQVFVLDIDNQAADKWWRETAQFGDVMDSTVRVKTSKGHHYYFWVPADDRTKGWSYHHDGISFDIRGAGQGVVVPPSIHESGVVYEWEKAPNPDEEHLGMVPAPDWIKTLESARAHVRDLGGPTPTEGPSKPSKITGDPKEPLPGGNVRSMLSELLNHPPKGADSGRNNWLARVAGHYAKTYRGQQDLYLLHLEHANHMLTPPLDREEFTKTVRSLWESEHNNHPERDIEKAGWLMASGDTILTQIKTGKGDASEIGLAEWSDFNIEVHNVVADSTGGEVVYDSTLIRKFDGRRIPVVVEGTTLGQPPKLTRWLGSYGVSIARPDNTYPSNPADATRLMRFLNAQNAPRAEMVPYIGWNPKAQGYLTFDGVIRAGSPGLEAFTTVRPNPALRVNNIVSAHYGFEDDRETAREVLREVASFHYEDTSAVFGSWWAACFLKPQIMQRLSLFPIMAIESASGAGKTNGMFNLMVRMNGNLTGPQAITGAAARDQIAANQNGIVWIDDLDRLDRLEEMLRATTSNESVSKKGIDNTANVTVQLVAPVIVSGEFLGLGSQKALMDRSVILNPKRPDNRMSLKNPGRPQWDDVVALVSRYPSANKQPGLSVLAGHYVQMALELADDVDRKIPGILKKVKKKNTGRQAEKIACILIGSWVFDRMLDPELEFDEVGPTEEQVWSWAFSDDATSGSAGEWDNQLTTEILPWALRTSDFASSPRMGRAVWVREQDDMLTPATVWVNPAMLADEWREHRRGQITERTDSRKAILDQLIRCAPEGEKPRKKVFDITGNSGSRRQAQYWAIMGEPADVVIQRAKGTRT